MKRFVFLPLLLILLCVSCGNDRVGEKIIISVLLPENPGEPFEDDLLEFIIPPLDLAKNIEPDIVLPTDRKKYSGSIIAPFPIFDSLEASIASLKVLQEHVKYNCYRSGHRSGFVGEGALRYKVMMCRIFVGSLITGDCMWRDRLVLGDTSLAYTVGFTSRALRDAFIESISGLINEDVFFEMVVNKRAKEGSYVLDRRYGLWVARVDNGMRWKYSSYHGMSLDIALPDDFPVFGVHIGAGGTSKDEECKRNLVGMRW